jgi:uncharacterized protein
MIAQTFNIQDEGRAADKWLAEVVKWTWKIKLLTRLELDLMGQLRDSAEEEGDSRVRGEYESHPSRVARR